MIQKRDLYSVYMHTSPSGKVYIGVSNNPKRRWGTYGAPYLYKNKNGNYTQSCFANAICKYGWENFKHEIILKNISFSEALYAERYLIKWYKMHHISYNMSDGGEYFSGTRGLLSDKRKLQIKLFMNTSHPMKGRHHTVESKIKMSKAAKNRQFSEEKKQLIHEKIRKSHLGKCFSEETKNKLRKDWKKHHKNIISFNKKEVHQYDFNGVYIASYSSVTEAAKAIHKKEGDISNCANGRNLSVGGYIWRYEKQDSIDMSMYKAIGNKLYLKRGYKRNVKDKKKFTGAVNQYTIGGEYIATFASVAEAKRATAAGKISDCCKHTQFSSGGYRWEYDTDSNRNNIAV